MIIMTQVKQELMWPDSTREHVITKLQHLHIVGCNAMEM